MGVFIGSYILISKGIADISPTLTLVTSAACFLVGLIGLSSFFIVIATVFIWGIKHRLVSLTNKDLSSQWLGIYAALVATTIIGVFDHYFVNLDFQSSQTCFWVIVGLALSVTRISQEIKN